VPENNQSISKREIAVSYIKELAQQGEISMIDGGEKGYFATYTKKVPGGSIQYTNISEDDEIQAIIDLLEMVEMLSKRKKPPPPATSN